MDPSTSSSKSGAHSLWQALLAQPESLLAECRRETYQGSGAGGQKRNRVRSGVRLVHDATGLRAENCEHREAGRNVAEALQQLRLQIALTLGERSALDEAGLPDTSLFLQAPLEAQARFRVEANAAHADYAITLALGLQALHQAKGRLAEAAASLGCTSSALNRHFKADKAAWATVLRMRQNFGLGPLK